MSDVAKKVKKFADEMSEAVSIGSLPDPKKIEQKTKERLKKLGEGIKGL